MTINYNDLQSYLRARMQAHGLNTITLSEALGFSKTYINSIYNGQFSPSKKKCLKIAEFFGDDPNIILGLTGYYVPPEITPTVDRITNLVASLPDEKQKAILRFAEYQRWLTDQETIQE